MCTISAIRIHSVQWCVLPISAFCVFLEHDKTGGGKPPKPRLLATLPMRLLEMVFIFCVNFLNVFQKSMVKGDLANHSLRLHQKSLGGF